jgi:hypothetical protein
VDSQRRAEEEFKMSRTILMAAALLATGFAAPAAFAADPAAPAHYTTADTTIGDLLDDPAAKAILVKNLPGFADNPQIDMARSMTLKQIQGMAGDALPDDKLAAVDAELAKLPPKK